jgi:hypothetical protein
MVACAVLLSATTAAASTAPLTTEARTASVGVPLSPCASSDNGFPELQSLALTPSKLDVRRRAAWLTITAQASDDGGPGPATGVRMVEVSLSGGLNLGLPVELAHQDDGSWQGRVLVPPGARPGTHSVQYVRLHDGTPLAGIVRGYSTADLRGMGQPTDVDVLSRRDREGPQLKSFSLSRTAVDLSRSAQTIRVRARVTDNIAGTHLVAVETDVGHTELRLGQGTRRDGTWTGTLRIPRWSWTGGSPYQVFVILRDRVSKDSLVYFDELADRGFPSMLTVTSSAKDTADPRLRRVTATPATVDVTSGDAKVAISVRAEDAVSGVATANVWDKHLKRTSGTAHDGVWRGFITIGSCSFRSGPFRPQLVAFDRASNRVTAKASITVVNGKDIKAPTVRSVEPFRASAAQPVTFTFTEDVTGITATSSPVRRTEPGFGFGTGDPPPAEAGSWTCSATSGAQVDCAVGPVRTATWTPSQPLTAGQSYGVDFNPEHVLDVLDLAGNPIDPDLRYEDEFAPTWSIVS